MTWQRIDPNGFTCFLLDLRVINRNSAIMVASFHNCRRRQAARLAQAVLMGVILLAIAMLPADANEMICAPSDHMEAQHAGGLAVDHPADCMTQASQSGQNAAQPDDAPDMSMHCMPAIGTALTSLEMTTPVLAGTLVQGDGWCYRASTG
ncbi:hypothetical protein ACEWPM_008635 [Roseovarius sp. S4756]|uniref:hypothetical protein n=1 Tax=Roseovarius maritimus TaxID=3342637 RepID=UPI00372BF2FC